MFRLFRLFMRIRKLSHPAKSGTWQFQDVQDVQPVQAFAQTLSRDKVQRHVAVSGFQDVQDVQDVQVVQAFTQTLSIEAEVKLQVDPMVATHRVPDLDLQPFDRLPRVSLDTPNKQKDKCSWRKKRNQRSQHLR
jgi:hypothetical protein